MFATKFEFHFLMFTRMTENEVKNENKKNEKSFLTMNDHRRIDKQQSWKEGKSVALSFIIAIYSHVVKGLC